VASNGPEHKWPKSLLSAIGLPLGAIAGWLGGGMALLIRP